MAKKKAATKKEALAQPAKAPKAGSDSSAAASENASNARMARSAPLASAARPAFRRLQSLNFAGVGRNDICPCGSGKRFKNCHGH